MNDDNDDFQAPNPLIEDNDNNDDEPPAAGAVSVEFKEPGIGISDAPTADPSHQSNPTAVVA